MCRKPSRIQQLTLFVRHFFSPGPRFLSSRKVEAKLLHLKPDTFRRRVLEAAALCHITSRLFVAALLSALLSAADLGTVNIVGAIRVCTFDETPLPMRTSSASSTFCRVNPDAMFAVVPEDVEALLAAEVIAPQRERGSMKIVQAHVCIAIVFQESSSGKMYHWLSFALPSCCGRQGHWTHIEHEPCRAPRPSMPGPGDGEG